jgi:hypothetical protein
MPSYSLRNYRNSCNCQAFFGLGDYDWGSAGLTKLLKESVEWDCATALWRIRLSLTPSVTRVVKHKKVRSLTNC